MYEDGVYKYPWLVELEDCMWLVTVALYISPEEVLLLCVL